MIRSADNSLIKADDKTLLTALETKGIGSYSFILTGEGLVKTKYRQQAVSLMGVDDRYPCTVKIDSIVFAGTFVTDRATALNVGAAIATEMQLGAGFVEAVEVIVPRRIGLINPLVPAGAFKSLQGQVASVFASGLQPEDNSIILSIDSLRKLLDYSDHEAEAVAIQLQTGSDAEQIALRLKETLGDSYQVLDLAGQHPEITHLIAMEKWMSYLILLFILVLATFNIVSSLSMLLIEKKEDIYTLHSMGATSQTISRIFRIEGLLVSMTGAAIGILIGIGLCVLQQQYGLITLQMGLGSVAYPVRMDAVDLVIIFLTIFTLSYLAAYYPVHYFINRRLKNS